MFNATRPDAYKMGSLIVCDASEEEIWTTEGKFKVGDEEHQPPEGRVGCPCNPDEPDGPSCRRQSQQEGKLDFARDKICKVLGKKGMPTDSGDESCTKWMGKVVPNSQGGDVPDCKDRFED
jgi:hypothetical protein